MTLAKRFAALIEIHFDGSLYQKRQMRSASIDSTLATIARFAQEGADEIWIRPALGKCKASVLQNLFQKIKGVVFVPVVLLDKPRRSISSFYVDGEADRVMVDLAEFDAFDPNAQLKAYVEILGPDRLGALIRSRRVAETERKWELLNSSFEPLSQDSMTILLELVELGALEIVVEQTGNQIDAEWLDLLTSTLPIPVALLAENIEDSQIQQAFMAGADCIALKNAVDLPPNWLSKAKGHAASLGFAVRDKIL